MSARVPEDRRRGREALFLLGALALAAPARAVAQEPAEGQRPTAASEQLPGVGGAEAAPAPGAVSKLLAPPAGGQAPDPEALVGAIRALGPGAIPELVAMLTGELEPLVVVPGTEDLPVHPLALEQRVSVLRAALARLPVEPVLDHLAARLARAPETSERLMIAGLLEELDDARACELLLAVAEGLDPLELRRRYVQATLEPALTAHLLRAPESSLELVWRSGLEAPPERLTLYARALGATRTARGVELMASWIGDHPGADAEILTQIGRVLGDGCLAIPPEALAAVRAELLAEEPDVRRSAVIAAGRLRDEAVFEELVEMLSGETELVAASARWSLHAICGIDLGVDAQAWLDWRERERTWLQERGPALLEELQSEVPGVVLAAVTESLRHPLHRHVVADSIGPLLVHPDPSVARATCVAIGRLGSSRAVPWLLAALRQHDPELREHAAAALRRLTGLDLPPQHARWSRALAG